MPFLLHKSQRLYHRSKKMTATLLDILGAVNFLHTNCWIHGDIKLDNIGIRNWNEAHPSIVLLDLDGALKCPRRDHVFEANPGTGGTIGWLSPEREMTGFAQVTDVWGVGVIALWMVLGRHPWRHHKNPWQPGQEYIAEQRLFDQKYEDALDRTREVRNTGTFNHSVRFFFCSQLSSCYQL